MKLTRAKLEQLVETLVQRTHGAGEAGAGRCGRQADGHRRGGARRRLDAHAAGAAGGEGILRQGAAQGRQSGRSRRRRRGNPGRRARGRGQGPPAAGRHAALARHRDAWRRDDGADPAQHDHPDEEERDLLDGGGQPDRGRGARAAGRAADGARQPDARTVPPGRAAAGAARRAAGRSDLRHRRQRHRQRRGEGQGHRQGTDHHDQRFERPEARTKWTAW